DDGEVGAPVAVEIPGGHIRSEVLVRARRLVRQQRPARQTVRAAPQDGHRALSEAVSDVLRGCGDGQVGVAVKVEVGCGPHRTPVVATLVAVGDTGAVLVDELLPSPRTGCGAVGDPHGTGRAGQR